MRYTKSFNLPLLLVGGGGYTPRNVARLWAYETALAIGAEDIDSQLPMHTPFREHFRDGTLFPPLSEMGNKFSNMNDRKYLEGLVMGARETLRYVKGAPSVAMRWIPPDVGGVREEVEREIGRRRREGEERRGVDGETEGRRRRKEAGGGGRGEMWVD